MTVLLRRNDLYDLLLEDFVVLSTAPVFDPPVYEVVRFLLTGFLQLRLALVANGEALVLVYLGATHKWSPLLR